MALGCRGAKAHDRARFQRQELAKKLKKGEDAKVPEKMPDDSVFKVAQDRQLQDSTQCLAPCISFPQAVFTG